MIQRLRTSVNCSQKSGLKKLDSLENFRKFSSMTEKAQNEDSKEKIACLKNLKSGSQEKFLEIKQEKLKNSLKKSEKKFDDKNRSEEFRNSFKHAKKDNETTFTNSSSHKTILPRNIKNNINFKNYCKTSKDVCQVTTSDSVCRKHKTSENLDF